MLFRLLAVAPLIVVTFACALLPATAYPVDKPAAFKVAVRGRVIKTPSLDEVKALAAPKKIRVFEPHEMREQTYTGIDTRVLLGKLYPHGWENADELILTCADGYQASVPITRLKTFDSYLVFEREGDPTFSVTNKHQNNEHVPLGPFYLVWDNIKSPELKKSGAMNWPYQVVGIELVALRDRFRHSLPIATTASAGFVVFRDKCMTCHKVNGEGGDKAPELNTPVSVTEYWRRDWLEKFIWDPRSVRTGSTMPGMKDMGTQAELKNVLEYLDAMQSQKRKY